MKKFTLKQVIGWDFYRAISAIEKNGYIWKHRDVRCENGFIIDKIMNRMGEIIEVKSKATDLDSIAVVVSVD